MIRNLSMCVEHEHWYIQQSFGIWKNITSQVDSSSYTYTDIGMKNRKWLNTKDNTSQFASNVKWIDHSKKKNGVNATDHTLVQHMDLNHFINSKQFELITRPVKKWTITKSILKFTKEKKNNTTINCHLHGNYIQRMWSN